MEDNEAFDLGCIRDPGMATVVVTPAGVAHLVEEIGHGKGKLYLRILYLTFIDVKRARISIL